MKTAVITGASGLVGGNLAELLIAAGVHVRGARRASTRIDHLADLAIEWVDAPLEAGALTRAFTGADVVFHCAAIATQTRRLDGGHKETNVDGTRHVIEAVRRAGVPRLVHCSSVVTCAIAKKGGPDVTEDDAWNFAAHGLDEIYAVTKRDAELAVLDAARTTGGIDAVVVNPGLMFGPRDSKPSGGRMILELASGRIMGSTSGNSTFVDVRDVCRGMIAAWHRGKRGERYILAGDNLSYAQAFALICEELGKRPPPALPDVGVRIAGRAGDLLERVLGSERMPLNSAVTTYGTCAGYRFSSAKAARALGYTIGPVRTAVRDAIAWFRSHQRL